MFKILIFLLDRTERLMSDIDSLLIYDERFRPATTVSELA